MVRSRPVWGALAPYARLQQGLSEKGAGWLNNKLDSLRVNKFRESAREREGTSKSGSLCARCSSLVVRSRSRSDIYQLG